MSADLGHDEHFKIINKKPIQQAYGDQRYLSEVVVDPRPNNQPSEHNSLLNDNSRNEFNLENGRDVTTFRIYRDSEVKNKSPSY